MKKRLAKFKGIECNLHRIVSEIIIGRVLIRLSVIQNFITIYRELSCEPRRELLIEVKLLRKLILHISFGRQLVSGRLRVDLVHDILVVGIWGWSAEGSHLDRGEAECPFVLGKL